jgi:uncharacterized membrane protein
LSKLFGIGSFSSRNAHGSAVGLSHDIQEFNPTQFQPFPRFGNTRGIRYDDDPNTRAVSTQSSNVPSPGQSAVLAIIVLLAAFLRFDQITGPSLWMDEIWSVEMAMGHGSAHDHLPPGVIQTDQAELTSLSGAASCWSIVTHLGGVTHPPLYFLTLRWWIDLFGTSPGAIRTLSAIFSVGIVVVLFDVCRWVHGVRIALYAAALCALSIAQIEFGQESRGYPMLIFFALCAGDALVRIEKLGPRAGRLTALGGFAVAAALTHYLAAGLLIALGVFAIARLRGRARWQTIVAFLIAAAVVLAVWIPLFVQQSHTLPSLAPTFLQESRVNEHAKMTLFRVVGLPVEFLLGETLGDQIRSAIVLAIFLFSLGLPVLRLYWRRDLLLWILWGWGTIGFVAAMDLAHQTTLVGYLRYTILASPAVYALIASFDWPRRNFIRDAVAISTVGLLAIVAARRAIDGIEPKEDWRTLNMELNQVAAPNDLLVFFNDDPWTSPGTWYMNFTYYVPNSRHPWLILDSPANAQVLRQLQPLTCLWLVGRFPQMQGPTILPGWAPAADQEQTSAGAFCPFVQIR